MIKTSIRFFDDVPVRAIWSEEDSKWYYAAVDIAFALTDSANPRVYWGVLKKRNYELFTICKQLKLTAKDGKKYLTDVLDDDGVNLIIAIIPSKKSEIFKKWMYSVGSWQKHENMA